MIAAGLFFLGICILAGAFILISVRAAQYNSVLVKKIFKYIIILTIGIVFSIASVLVGLRLDERNSSSFSKVSTSVMQIWGGRIFQNLPSVWYDSTAEEQYTDEKTGEYRTRIKEVRVITGFLDHNVKIDIRSNIRKKGLMKFAGYNLGFSSSYKFKNTSDRKLVYNFNFPLPSEAGNITGIAVNLNGEKYTGDVNYADGIDWKGELSPDEEVKFDVVYNAQGLNVFEYGLGSSLNRNQEYSVEPAQKNVAAGVEVGSFYTELATDFTDVIIPDGAMAPSSGLTDDQGSIYKWESANLVLTQKIGLDFTIKANYGEIFAKIFYYSPITIFLFIAFLLVFSIARQIRIHPVNFIFVMAGFFVYYLLSSYLVSYLNILVAIAISLTVSTLMSVYYIYSMSKNGELTKIAALCFVIFQWFFSATFFFPKHTGLMITLASVAALFILMKLTAAIDWENKW
ncbi:MAG: hypothetical protein JXK07_11340 [Spirochaetes bacterium]|nr:hypothetical protein [Spirochaetota bacterium]MBN2772460.1 hypothetical protein [Spirochaetota bacterium]